MNIKNIDLTVGIYDTCASITRHKNGNVTVRNPYISGLPLYRIDLLNPATDLPDQ